MLVAAATAAAILSRPSTTYCQFSCGPELGPRLLSPTAYQNPEFGYRVEYQSQYFTLGHQSPSGVGSDANQANFMVFNAAQGGDVDSAIQSVLNGLSTSEYQDLHQVSSVVPGAEIGFVPGSGEAFTADFVAPGAGSSQPVSVVVMAATQANLTITVLVVGSQDLSNYAFIPFGFEYGQLFDFEPSNTTWPGGT